MIVAQVEEPTDRGAEARIAALRASIARMPSVLVCFSGGVDSSYLLAESLSVLGRERVVAFTAVSASLDPDEARAARELAAALGARHALVETSELDDARYTSNPADRCYFCKSEVYGVAVRWARERDLHSVADGFNVDDRRDHRPGRKAARELGVISPLDEHGLDKADIRAGARALGLPTAEKPALACLASRFPTGTPITVPALARVARAEKALRGLGFTVVRVRDASGAARIEIGADELPRLDDPELRERALASVHAEGFARVAIDPLGYRRGGAG